MPKSVSVCACVRSDGVYKCLTKCFSCLSSSVLSSVICCWILHSSSDCSFMMSEEKDRRKKKLDSKGSQNLK